MSPEDSGYHVTGIDKRGDGAPDWIRTSDLQLRRLPLYPSELRARRIDFGSILPDSLPGWVPGGGDLGQQLDFRVQEPTGQIAAGGAF